MARATTGTKKPGKHPARRKKAEPKRETSLVTRKPSGPEGGAPEIVIDMAALQSLVEIQCTAEECASVMGISVDTIDRRLKEAGYAGFADFYKKHMDSGKTSLRRAQWKAATIDHNPTMLVWLGKQVLGQKDRQEVELTVSDDIAEMLDARRKRAKASKPG
jgi:hypothetical protein